MCCLQLDRLSRAVASAHMPLVLLCMGISLTEQRPWAVQVRHSFICKYCQRSTSICHDISIGSLGALVLGSWCMHNLAHGACRPEMLRASWRCAGCRRCWRPLPWLRSPRPMHGMLL